LFHCFVLGLSRKTAVGPALAIVEITGQVRTSILPRVLGQSLVHFSHVAN
jgi:hypothetical protein